MKIFPTVNIQNAQAVPLFGTGGRGCEPMKLVDFILAQGCHRMSLVDVDAARGKGHNRDLLARMMHRFHLGAGKACIQVGGGIRSSDQAQFFVDHGATWLLVGTLLHRSPQLVDQLVARFRDNLTAGLDVRGGELQASGWGEPSRLKLEAAGAHIKRYGFKRILFNDLPTVPGAQPDFETARIIQNSSHTSLFMGGSIHSLARMRQAMALPGLQGFALDAFQMQDDPELASTLNLQQT